MSLHNHKIPKHSLFCDVKNRMLFKFALKLMDILDTVLVILKENIISKTINNRPDNSFLKGIVCVISSNPQIKEGKARFITVPFETMTVHRVKRTIILKPT